MVKDSGVAVRPDSVAVEFDDERLVANAGVMLTSTLVNRLGLERLVDETVDLGQRPGRREAGPQGAARWCTRSCWEPIRSTTATCCGPGAPRRCLATG